MEYEIKNIRLSSVLKMSFFTLLTTGTVFFTFTTLVILRLVSRITQGIEGVESVASMSLGGIIVSAFFMGVLLSVLLVFWIAIIIIFYNFFASFLGGVKVDLSNKKSPKI